MKMKAKMKPHPPWKCLAGCKLQTSLGFFCSLQWSALPSARHWFAECFNLRPGFCSASFTPFFQLLSDTFRYFFRRRIFSYFQLLFVFSNSSPLKTFPFGQRHGTCKKQMTFKTMTIPFSNNKRAVPKTSRVSVEFFQSLPIQLEIRNPMRTSLSPKPAMPSLFHIAACLDNRPPAVGKSPFVRLPLDNWTFSRERLERALKSRLSEIKKRRASAAKRVAKQPLLQIARRIKKIGREARPVQYHPFGTVNSTAEAA